MKARWLFQMVARELLGMRLRLLFFVVTIAIGVASYVALVGMSDAFLASVNGKIRLFLGGDVVVSARKPLPDSVVKRAMNWPGVLGATRQSETTSMISWEGSDPRLVEVRVIDAAFPLLNEVRTEPPEAMREFSTGVLVDGTLGRNVGQNIHLGEGNLVVDGIIIQASGLDGASFFSLPRVYVRPATARQLGLVGNESRFQDRVLLTFQPGSPLKEISEEMNRAFRPEKARVQTYSQSADRLEARVRNVGAFVLVVGMSCLILASLAAANGILEYLRQRFLDAAILRCMGISPGTALSIFAMTISSIVLMGTMAGLAGAFAMDVALQSVPFVKAAGIETATSDLLWRGFQVGVVLMLMIFLTIIPRLSALARQAPAEALRDANAVRFSAVWELTLISLGTILLPILYLAQAGVNRFSLAVAFACVVLLTIFGFLGHAALRVSQSLADRSPLPIRLALREVASRRSGSVLVLAVIGFSVFLSLTVLSLRTDLLEPLQSEFNRPNVYLVDVQTNQKEAVKSALAQAGAERVVTAPLVRGRLVAFAGKPVNALEGADENLSQEEDRESHHWRDRELNLTFREGLSQGEKIVAGEFWRSGDTAQVSLEVRMAARIGIRLGDAVELDVQGVPVQATVTSLRSVAWQTGLPNFFWVLHPKLLDGAPQVHLIAATVAGTQERSQLKKALARDFGNVSIIDASEVIGRITEINRNLESVVNLLGGAMLVVATLLLATGVAATRYLRERHLAILRSIGLRRGPLLTSVALEFLFLGVVGAAVGAVASMVISRVAVTTLLEMEPTVRWQAPLVAVALSGTLCLVAGIMTMTGILKRKPLEVLRA